MPRPKGSTNAEVLRIVQAIEAGDRQSLVILIVPSHTRWKMEIAAQDIWADAALDLFAELYGGATAFNTYAGIYRNKDSQEHLKDRPILIESYVDKNRVRDVRSLTQLVDFMKRMGRETEQLAVAVVIDNTFHEITDY